MAEEWEKYAIFKNQFRRRSSTEFTGTGFSQVVHTDKVPKLLGEFGTKDMNEIQKTINQVDPNHTGRLNFQQYSQICDKLVKDPTMNPISMEFKAMSDFETP